MCSFLFFPDRPTHLHETEGAGKRNILLGCRYEKKLRYSSPHKDHLYEENKSWITQAAAYIRHEVIPYKLYILTSSRLTQAADNTKVIELDLNELRNHSYKGHRGLFEAYVRRELALRKRKDFPRSSESSRNSVITMTTGAITSTKTRH